MGYRNLRIVGDVMESNDGYSLCIYNEYLKCEKCGECDSPKSFTVKVYDSEGNMETKTIDY